MKITIDFNSNLDFSNEELKRFIDREDFNERIKSAIDNELGMKVVNAFGRWVYIIKVDKE